MRDGGGGSTREITYSHKHPKRTCDAKRIEYVFLTEKREKEKRVEKPERRNL